MNRIGKIFQNASIHTIFLISLLITVGFSAPVNPNEAIQIADLWYAMELNSGYLDITEQEKADRFSQMENHAVQYMMSKDELLNVYPTDQRVLAYIVQYSPSGFVVVSGDDRMEPIMVCSAISEFRWDQPERNFLRYYLGKVMPGYWEDMPLHKHPNWSFFRSKMPQPRNTVTFDNIGRGVYVEWNTATWNQKGYYNDTCEAHNGDFDVCTGCVATALAIKLKFHSWPLVGYSSHSYTDNQGSVQYAHDVDYSSQSYDWESMPNGSVTSPNSQVARIMYHAGVAVDMDYEVDASGANVSKIAGAMNDYFRYRGTTYLNGGISVHEYGLQTSIIGRLPVQIGGWGHSVLCDGYREDYTKQYHINAGWNGVSNGWYKLDSLPGGGGAISQSSPYGQPNNWVYVNYAWAGSEYGLITQPFNTLSEGHTGMPPGGELLIRSGFYTGTGNVPITFNRTGNIRAYAGYVVIGDNVKLRNYQAIRLHDDGEMKITP